MKKILALVMALVMVLSLGTVAFAAGNTDINGEGAVNGGKTGEVKVAVTGLAGATDVYYVEVTWGDLSFTYNFNESANVWNPENHQYDITAGQGSWSAASSDITIKNHSSKAVTASAKFDNGEASKTVNGVTATVSGAVTVNAPVIGSSFNSAPTGTITVSISDNAPSVKEAFTVGIITLTIN